MTTPTGGPAWTRSADFATYGGHLEKANFQGEPVINPKTDVDAGHLQRLSADLAALTRVAPFCQMSFSAVAAGSTVTVHECRLMTGVTAAAYDGAAPPAGFPGVTHVSAQVLAIEIGGLYSDD